VINFSVAVGKPYKDEDGEWQDNTTWFDVVAWEKTAEILADTLAVGNRVWLAGESAVKSYIDKTEQHRASIEITVRWPDIMIFDLKSRGKDQPAVRDDGKNEQLTNWTAEDDDLPF
jgi:single-strand DNA-binding protein